MYPATKVFLLEPTETQRRYARCYDHSDNNKCEQSGLSYHNAEVLVDVIPIERTSEGNVALPSQLADDAPWPVECSCGFKFLRSDRQTFNVPLYRRVDTGELLSLRDAPPGAMWDATWYPTKGPDGRCLIVKCPNGHEWNIDSLASNCTRRSEDHQCWVRHGEPPNITVDKDGNTCAAGAGSIMAGDYHGFLRNGEFTAG